MKIQSTEPSEAQSEASVPGCSATLAERFDRLRALRAAWGVLAGSTLSGGGHPVAEIGRVLGDHLNDLARQGADEHSPEALASADAGLDEFARMLRSIAFEVSINELRAILPGKVRSDRRGVLDLLDLLVDFDCEIDERPEHVGAIDYVITLLATGERNGGAAQIRHDPVTLTPRLHALCQRVEASEDAALLSEIETEFFAAARMDREDVYVEMAQRTLRRRKFEIGQAFYAPKVLRAIVTYNAALLQQVSDEISESQDWGTLPVEGAAAEPDEAPSVFASRALVALGASVRRRADGAAPDTGAVDRVAWCLDLDCLAESERRLLLADGVGEASNPRGTAILVGLITRSLVVLEDELAALGVSAEWLSGRWVRELDHALKAVSSALIASDSYDEACAIAGLQSKFLSGPDGAQAPPIPVAPVKAAASPQARDEVEDEEAEERKPAPARSLARELAEDALEQVSEAPQAEPGGFVLPEWVRAGVAVTATLAIVVFGANLILTEANSDLEKWRGSKLEVVSPYLTHGHRNGHGSGTAFVGFLDDAWNALDATTRTDAALDLVASLRAQGVRDIMIYDKHDRLRLQLLGDQPLRLVE